MGGRYAGPMRVMVAGMGNVLRLDDAFGVAVIEHLARSPVPEEVTLMDAGIGGIHLVQELMTPFDMLLLVDAADFGRPPGTLAVIKPDVVDVQAMSLFARNDELADMHYATPDRALMLAKALGVLPEDHWIVGCQPLDAHGLGEGMSTLVDQAVPAAADEVRRIVAAAGVDWPRPVE